MRHHDFMKNSTNHRLPLPKVLAVDVDGTLKTSGGEVRQGVLARVLTMKADGFKVMLWSMRGEDYTRRFADGNGIAELFDVICGKPGHIIDDAGWGWTKQTKLHPVEDE